LKSIWTFAWLRIDSFRNNKTVKFEFKFVLCSIIIIIIITLMSELIDSNYVAELAKGLNIG